MMDTATAPRRTPDSMRAANARYWNDRARSHDVRGDGNADTMKNRPMARVDGRNAVRSSGAAQPPRTRTASMAALDATGTALAAHDAGIVATNAAGAARGAHRVATKAVARGRSGAAAAPRHARTSAAITKATGAVARAADTRMGSQALQMLSTAANSRVAQVAAKASIPFLAFRAGMNATIGYQQDGMRGAARGLISTVDPTALLSMAAGALGADRSAGGLGDGRGIGERLFDRIAGRAPGVGAFLDQAAAARTKSNEAQAKAKGEDSQTGMRQAAAPEQHGNGTVKAYTRKDGTPVAGYQRTPGASL